MSLTDRLQRKCECGLPVFHTGDHLRPLRSQPLWLMRAGKDLTGALREAI